MKKVVNLLAIVAVFALATTSCKKKEPKVEVETEAVNVETEHEQVPVNVEEQRGDTIEKRVDTLEVDKTTITPAN